MSYLDGISTVAKKLNIKKGNILVTGATGLIGSYLIDTLLYANEHCDCKFTIYAMSRSLEKVQNRFGSTVIPVVQNVQDPLNLKVDLDFIVHAASNADPKTYAKYPVDTIMTNIEGTKNILEYCKNNTECKLLYTSTFEVYGKIENHDVYKEEDAGTIDFHVLRNGYPESKRCCELLIQSYVKQYGVNAVITRLPSVYGPTMQKDDSKAHAQFVRNALNHENIVLKSKGEQRRTYCYVSDIVSGMLFLLFNHTDSGESYNISNENSIVSIAELAQTVANIAGTKVVFDLPDELESAGFSKPQNNILDNSKLKQLGWFANYSLDKGLLETMNVLKENGE